MASAKGKVRLLSLDYSDFFGVPSNRDIGD